MIGSHDSFTYKSPENPIFKLFSIFWKTQSLTLEQQYNKGVRYFDIRIRYTENKTLQPCHGIVDLGIGQYSSLYNLITTLHGKFPKAKFRVILERGNESIFIKESEEIKNLFYIDQIAIKKNWKVIKESKLAFIDYTWCPFRSDYSLKENIKNWWKTTRFSTIKKWAKKHNPQITPELIDSEIIYFIDFV